MRMLTMNDVELRGKRVLIREDLNVPLTGGNITNAARLQAALPTIQQASAAGAAVMVMSHLGRPTEGDYDTAFSLAPVAEYLSNALDQPVPLISDYLSNAIDITPGQVVLLENVRFNPGEKANDPKLSQQLARLCDVFVMDAFATAHRAQASTVGVAEYAETACAGPLLEQELHALNNVMQHAEHPVVAIVGGAKVSSKLSVLEHLLTKVDALIVGGGIANTFLKAAGYAIGESLYEADLLTTASHILQTAKANGVSIPLPQDVHVAARFDKTATATLSTVDAVNTGMILDIGPHTAKHFSELLQQAKTILWNGPVGVFEFPQFSQGTKAIAEAIANSTAFSVAGGGDTLAAIDQFGVRDNISYISTGGGAFLEFIEGKTLPAVTILNKRAAA